VKILSVYY
jgi:hypothetical protein